MATLERPPLKSLFTTGLKPSQEDFANLIDSFVNILEDGLSVDAGFNLILSGGLQLGNSTSTTPGTLRFNGVDVEFFDGAAWTAVGSGSSVFTDTGGGTVAYAGGNVGIGNLGGPPTHLLDIALGENTGPTQRVRFGNSTISNGGGAGAADAYFYHQATDTTGGFALRQRQNGQVQLNAPTGQTIRLQHNGNTVRLVVTANGEVVVGSSAALPGSGGAVFQVNGSAFKNNGVSAWDNTSDSRVKKDIRDFEFGLEEIKRIRPVRYRYTGAAGTIEDLDGIGVIGQEIEQIIPETVRKAPAGEIDSNDIDDLRIYNSSALTYVLINSVKQLSTLVDQQQHEIEQLKLKGAANDSE
jgi:hypothetical protein